MRLSSSHKWKIMGTWKAKPIGYKIHEKLLKDKLCHQYRDVQVGSIFTDEKLLFLNWRKLVNQHIVGFNFLLLSTTGLLEIRQAGYSIFGYACLWLKDKKLASDVFLILHFCKYSSWDNIAAEE